MATDRAALAERVINRLRGDEEFLADNPHDAGEAAFDFIRHARERNEQRTQAERAGSLRANVERCLAAMRAGREG